MRRGKKQKNPSDIVNNAGERDTIVAEHPSIIVSNLGEGNTIEAEDPALAEVKYVHQKHDGNNKGFMRQHGFLLKKLRHSCHLK